MSAETDAPLEPLRLTQVIRCPPAHAFDVWTRHIATWWPKGHSVSGDPAAVVVLEPHRGGRILERTSDGREIDWGEITEWSPPTRLGFLWHISRDRGDATEVELTFADQGDGTTRLDIVQTGWERLGREGAAWRQSNTQGWGAVLPVFTAAAEG